MDAFYIGLMQGAVIVPMALLTALLVLCVSGEEKKNDDNGD